MLISDLERSEGITHAYKVRVDAPGFIPPVGLVEVGILVNGDGLGAIHADIADTIIAYRNNPTKVIMEVEHWEDLQPAEVFGFAVNADCNVSLLPPPASADSRVWDDYSRKLTEYTKVWFKHPHASSMIYPVSSFFGYMAGRAVGFTPGSVATDPYMVSNFVDDFPLDRMDQIKYRLEAEILAMFGGREEFQKYILSVASAIRQKVQGMADDFAHSNRSNG